MPRVDPVRRSRQRLAACKDGMSRPPARPLRHSQDSVPVCFTPSGVAGGESFVSVEVAGSNGPRQRLHGDALSVTELDSSFPPRGCTVPLALYCDIFKLGGAPLPFGRLACLACRGILAAPVPSGREGKRNRNAPLGTHAGLLGADAELLFGFPLCLYPAAGARFPVHGEPDALPVLGDRRYFTLLRDITVPTARAGRSHEKEGAPPCGLEPHARRRASPVGVQADSHRLMQVFHGALLAPASTVGDGFPGRRRATARRLPERPHACCGCGKDGRLTLHRKVVAFRQRLRPYRPEHARGGHEDGQGDCYVDWHAWSPF